MLAKNRPSLFVARQLCCNVIGAAVYAFCIGKPLNRFISIHCEKAGIKSDFPSFVTRFKKHAGDWLRQRADESLYCVWVLENPPWDDKKRGGHNAHILIHVPDDLWHDFQRAQRGWLIASGGEWKRGVVHSQPMRMYQSGVDIFDYLDEGLVGSLRYILKGAHPSACTEFGIVHAPQGLIKGKRCGYSESLSPIHRRWDTIQLSKYPRAWIASPASRRLLLLSHGFNSFGACARMADPKSGIKSFTPSKHTPKSAR